VSERKTEIRTDFGHTEQGLADIFVTRNADRIRYSPERRRWLVWDGKRWAWDTLGQVRAYLQDEVLRLMTAVKEHIEEGNTDEAQRLAKFATGAAREPFQRHVLKLAEVIPGIPLELTDLDRDPWALNVSNGTIDLRTGELHDHDPHDLISRLAPVEYDPDAECPRWLDFLNRVTDGRDGISGFLQRVIGYALTAITSLQVWFLLFGRGANGKSVFLGTISAMLGDYARTADSTTFLAYNPSSIRNDVARLRGARMVTAIEAEGEKRLAEVLVKQLTGGDTVSARFLYGEIFEFRPECKLFLAANHKPRITGTDLATWRRIRLIPFTVTIPEDEQDPDLADKLKEELPGVLAWAVRGCLQWQESGLQPPDEVTAAVQDYRDEQDVLGAFLNECCILGATVEEEHAALYTAYKEWADRSGEKTESARKFALLLEERGIEKRRGTGGKTIRVGIALKPESDRSD